MTHQVLADVCCVIVSYHRTEMLNECLDKILSATAMPAQIIIIDNSQQISVIDASLLEQNLCKIQHIHVPENIGGAGGFKKGIEQALAQDQQWQYIWLMDDDVEPQVDTLKTLYASATKDSIVVPYRQYNDGSSAEYAGIKFNFSNPFLYRAKREEVCQKYPTPDTIKNTLLISAFAFEGPLIPVNIIQNIGLPNEHFFIFGDDTDFALRAKAANYQSYIVANARLLRKLEKPSRDESLTSWRARYILRNSFIMDYLHGKNFAVKYCRPIFICALVIGYLLLKVRNIQATTIAFKSLIEAFKVRKKFL